MDDSDIQRHIEQLVAEEHRLMDRGGQGGLGADDHERLHAVQVALDQYWDLLRQRRAREEFGQDPDAVHLRGADEVEGFQQ